MRPYKLFVWFLITCAFGVFCALAGYMVIILNGEKLYRENLHKMDMAESAKVYDVNGTEVATLYRAGENREYVTMKDIPERLAQAFIATEDKRFNEHAGIDFWAIGRALYKDIVARGAVEGGSTITQQLAKNMFLDADKTIFRKATEASIALALENHLSKEEILERYLNRIYFGKRAYGVKAAAKQYFGKSDLNKLELWEMATLAAIPKAPAYYNPIDNPERSKERRGVVLKLMQEQGYITEQERAEAAAVDYNYAPPASASQYTTFIDYMLNEAVEVTGKSEDELLRGGYKLYTTMDANAQKIVEQTYAKDALFQKDGPNQKMQSAMVIVNHKDGGIVAMIGGRDYKSKDWNRAVKPRQPGSSFKPIIAYAPALETGKWNPYSMLKDEKMTFPGNYSPDNWDNVYLGEITMMHALQKSANVASVWLLQQVANDKGIEYAINFAAKLGIPLDRNKDRNLAIALGGLTQGVSPLQMASAYGAFANNGLLVKSHSIVKILDSKGKEVYVAKTKPERVMSEKTAWYMTVMLKNAVDRGTGASAKMNRPVAGKTGTTQLDIKGLEKYNRDIWFVGYTPEWTAAVWMGFDQTDSKHYVSGGSERPAVLFKEVMSKALANRPVTPFAKPKDVPDLNEPPQTVKDLTAVYSPEQKAVKLSWTPVKGDNIVYRLFRKGTKDQAFVELPRGTTPEANDYPLPGDTYQYYVVPYNSATNAEADKSNVVTVEVPANPGAPDPLKPLDPLLPGGGAGNGGPGQGTDSQPGRGAGGGIGAPGGNGGGTGTPGTGAGPGAGKPGAGTGTQPGGIGAPGTGPGAETGAGAGTGTGAGAGGSGAGNATRAPGTEGAGAVAPGPGPATGGQTAPRTSDGSAVPAPTAPASR